MKHILPYIVPVSIVVILTLIIFLAHQSSFFQFWNYRFDHTVGAIIIFITIDFLYRHCIMDKYKHYFVYVSTLLLAIGSETSVIFEKCYKFAFTDIFPILMYIIATYVILMENREPRTSN